MDRYLLDTNFWITASNYYPEDVFPSFWQEIQNLLGSGLIVLHETVFEEIKRQRDTVTEWLEGVSNLEVLRASERTLYKYIEMCEWVEKPEQRYYKHAIDEFKDNSRADAWICAEAAVSDLVLVTNETKKMSPSKVKIPNVCEAFGVAYISNLDFMRAMAFRF